ncbi:hypothetical protein SEA_HANS_12 [Gordonia phage Hans]|uniref:Uncharacterized protein n=1 Tax=Gordonia Phage Phauci TaxID=2951392 RepID=A0A9E7NKF4_9CAUD|nr:hypothetical protein SEA_HANS_12 [Gordonia phage Hans]UTN93090.1 hypothetical protein SEA_PHAUCI_3 [Gordonia Phage Phauci]
MTTNTPALRTNPWDDVAPTPRFKSALATIPEPPKSTVLTFSKRYPGSTRTYTFAALKVRKNVWALTGRETSTFTWLELLEFIGDGERDGLGWRTIRYATSWGSPTE